jgi:predicted amidohydrolase
MEERMIRVGFFQFRPTFGKVEHNLCKVVTALKNVSADIIVLPELPFTGYNFKDRDELKSLSEEVADSTIVETLTCICRDGNFYLVTGFAEKRSDKYFNSSLLIGPEGVIHTYRKLHLFNEEKKWFDPGDIPLEINEVLDVKIGMMICFDWIFPEVFRALAILGADIVCHPSNLVLNYCQQTMISRCLENSTFAITANRFGADKRPHGEIVFTGKSQIVAPKGDLIYKAPSRRETLHITDINIEQARDKMITPLNDIIKDRRQEFYEVLCRRIPVFDKRFS